MKEWFLSVLNNIGWEIVVAFAVTQLVNVILSTIKSVLTIKGTRTSATLINTISYTLNAGVISQIGKVNDIPTVCIITAVSNLIGVSFSLWLLDKLRKDQLWRISVTVKTEKLLEFKEALLKKNLKFVSYETSWNEYKVVDIFSANRKESDVIKTVIDEFHVKYTVMENRTIL